MNRVILQNTTKIFLVLEKYFTLNYFQEKIVQDLSKLSKAEKIQVLGNLSCCMIRRNKSSRKCKPCPLLVHSQTSQHVHAQITWLLSCKIYFYDNCTILAQFHWLIFIVNKQTDTWIYNLCNAATSESGQIFDSMLS